jgi:hypothetical protein
MAARAKMPLIVGAGGVSTLEPAKTIVGLRTCLAAL